MKTAVAEPLRRVLPKAPTNIRGLDEILGGGLPKGRPTLVCGGAGCGKTLLAMEFLFHGATKFKEPGVFISFEETEEELTANVASLGFDVADLVSRKKLWLKYIHIDPGEIGPSAAYDLSGLFVRIHDAIENLGAKRVVLDTAESLFSGLASPHILRAELRRLLRWMKKKGVTTIVTAERGQNELTREGLEGTAGTGKTSLASHFVASACKKGKSVLFFTFEESPDQLVRNMRSIGIDLVPWVNEGRLLFHATRPTHYGLETHLATSIKLIDNFTPDIVVLDPITAFADGENQSDVKTMLLRLVDYLKTKGITAFFTSLTSGDKGVETTDVYVSSLIDTWLLLRDIEEGGERNKGLYVLKSRGMEHSNQIREFRLTNHGIELLDVYVGPGGVLTGSARLAMEAEDDAAQSLRQQEIVRKQVALDRKREAMEAQILLLRAEFEADESEALKLISVETARHERFAHDRAIMAQSREGDAP